LKFFESFAQGEHMAILDSLPDVAPASAENHAGETGRAPKDGAIADSLPNDGFVQMEVVRIFLPGELDSEDLAAAIRRLLALDDAA
jgi:hypothetical protein